jgi:hypothetical protein
MNNNKVAFQITLFVREDGQIQVESSGDAPPSSVIEIAENLINLAHRVVASAAPPEVC